MIKRSLALLAVLALGASACSADSADDAAAQVATTLSENQPTTSALDSPPDESAPATSDSEYPTRIISLSPTATEMLWAIGAGDQVVAVDEFSYFPEGTPVTELSGWNPNIEAIASYEPDFVVTESPIEGLDTIGAETLVLSAAFTFDDVYTQIEQLGAITGNVGNAAELVAQMQADIAAAVAGLPDREAPLTYYHELDNTLFTVTSSTFIGEVYSVLGLQNVADAADPDGDAFGYPQLNEEFLITADPDLIFLADTLCCEQTAQSVATRPGWDQLSAVKNGNVIEMDDDVASRWGPRLVDFIEAAARAINQVELAPAE